MLPPWLEPDPDITYLVKVLGPEENRERTVVVQNVAEPEEAIRFAYQALGVDEADRVDCEVSHSQSCICHNCSAAETAFREEQRRDDE